jgi:homopolymeric O-antigen transport system permease protein
LITHLVHFLLALPILLLFVLFSGGRFTGALLMLPVVIVVQLILTLSLADLIATFQVTFRDTQYLAGILLLLLFYVSPVIYDPRAVPEPYQPLYRLNPMVHLIDAYRAIFLRGEPPDALGLLLLGMSSAGLLWFAHSFFIQASYRFAEEL